jgi:endoglucanase
VNPYTDPKRWADNNRSSRSDDAKLMDKIANQPETQWFGNWNNNVYEDVKRNVETIKNAGALPTMVAYNIPARDCGGYSAGGANSPEGYKSWIKSFADGIGSNKAAVILEPDALAGMDCLSQNDQNIRLDLLKYAVDTLKARGNISVYIDAGHPKWKTPEVISDRLKKAGIANAQGFSLNISNFFGNEDVATYAKKVSDLTGGKHYVSDTGRNGNGPTLDNQWCNPWGRALGTAPTTNTGNALADAYLWVRGPSGSDGYCNGGPSAGSFWPEYGLDLARNTHW